MSIALVLRPGEGPDPSELVMLKILIAEDDRDIRELEALTLRFNGYAVVAVADGKTAVNTAMTQPFDLIILDITMPYFSGLEVCRRLQAQESTRHIPIVLVTAKGTKMDVQRGKDAGASAYIVKPFAPDVLLQTVQDILGKRDD